MITEELRLRMYNFALGLIKGLGENFDGDYWCAFNDDWDINLFEEEMPDRLVVWATAYPVVNGVIDTRSFHRLGRVATLNS